VSDFILNLIDDDEIENDVIGRSWKVAIIDDEESVHDVTKLALSDIRIQGLKVEFISAYSGKEGFALLQANPDCSAVLLDVVMETSDAGLVLAQRIRNELKLATIQIILRTGQPGYAPEEDIISKYEINDYKTKSELTRDKLFTSLATAIRSFSHLEALEESKKGLRSVIDASASLLKERSVHDFSSGVLRQINALFNLSSQGIFCVSQQPLNGPKELNTSTRNTFLVVAATQKYKTIYGKNIDDISSNVAVQVAQRTLSDKNNIVGNGFTSLYLSTPSKWQGVVVMEGGLNLNEVDSELLRVFCLNISIGLENAKYFSHLNRSAYYDTLTGLYNKEGLLQFTDSLNRQTNELVNLYIIDIDYFHDITDSLGEEFSDDVLVAMTRILKSSFHEGSLIARLHSDVFAVLVKNSTWSLSGIINECSRPFMLAGNSMRLGVSLGEAHCDPGESFDVDSLIRHASMALKIAKDNKRGMGQEFELQFEQDRLSRRNTLAEFRNALVKDELFLVLQPKTSMSSGDVVGYEALVRWQHPDKGLVPPNAFIPIIEQAGLYFELDMYVFRSGLNIIKQYPQINKPISVNVSANSLHHQDFIGELKAIIKEEQVDLTNIELEITENALIRSDMALQHLKELKSLGFTLCLDDFGAGYSSLAYLVKLPLDVIKIDRAFINHITDNKNSLVLLKGMLQICQDLNKKVVVEGVETQEQVDLLTQYNVDIAQGFFYFKPMKISDVLKSAL